jgi:hypothetical protein
MHSESAQRERRSGTQSELERTHDSIGEYSPEGITMVLRLFVFTVFICIGVSLSGAPALAEQPKAEPPNAAVGQLEQTVTPAPTRETARDAVTPLPAKSPRTRLSTRERWRGKPYLRNVSNESLRARALDIALPPANPAFQGGASLSSQIH